MEHQQQQQPCYDQRLYYQQPSQQQDPTVGLSYYSPPMHAQPLPPQQQQQQQQPQQDPYYRNYSTSPYEPQAAFPDYSKQPIFSAAQQHLQPQDQMPSRLPQPEIQRYEAAPSSMTMGFDFFPPVPPPPTNGISTYDTLATSPLLDNNRVTLRIEGDLEAMFDGWTAEEWTQRRRLVQFWRDEDDHLIRCGFQPVAQEAHRGQVNSIEGFTIVSCIYWPERNDYFITSVDLIHLLEVVMHMQFTVEEKNRVRRNLEGFRPLTVSKSRLDSADFFKLIMNFPHPKPRNIEKDLKVFPWRTLPLALNKIVAKYRMIQK